MSALNGISWLCTKTARLDQAKERMQAQCPVSTKVHFPMVATEHDPFALAYEERKAQTIESIRRQLELQEQAPIHDRVLSRPVPTYGELAEQHEGQ